ncbi:hypothetical protein AHAS_Ahas16G0189600 [Arachis hypogaea]
MVSTSVTIAVVKKTLMAANRHNTRRANSNNELILNTVAILETINVMVVAMRNSVATTSWAVECLGRHNENGNANENGNENYNGYDNGAPDGDRPLTLASFLKVNLPQFTGTTDAIIADD